MKKKYNFTTKEAIIHICKVLKIKPINLDYNSFYVRKLSTLKRIETWINKDLIIGKYSNYNANVKVTSTHYYLDIWVGDSLLTIRCDI